MQESIKVNYYDRFQCISKACPFSCCQEWRISVDDVTRMKWECASLKDSARSLAEVLESDEEGYIIGLNTNKQCPFLDERKLCKLVCELGEDMLSDTCKRFPREINTFEHRVEYALNFGCPAVIDLIHEGVDSVDFIGESKQVEWMDGLSQVREMIIALLKKDKYSLPERIMFTFYTLLDYLESDEIENKNLKDYQNEEYIQCLITEIRKIPVECISSFWERNELFLDMVQLYRKQELYVDYLEEISNFAERLDVEYSDQQLTDYWIEFEKLYGEYQKLLTNYLVAEMWSNCLKQEMTLEDIVRVFEWIVLEYCIIKQAVFLKWLLQARTTIEYPLVRDYMMIVARIAGYNATDIEEYLENSFECSILEWGYLALIVGVGKI